SGERGRGSIDLADDDAVTPLDRSVRNRFHESGRNVHYDVALGKKEIRATQSFQRGFELFDAVLDRHIERFGGLRADAAAPLEAMAQLEFFDRRGHRVVVAITSLRIGRQVAGDHEVPAQYRDRRIARARRELDV